MTGGAVLAGALFATGAALTARGLTRRACAAPRRSVGKASARRSRAGAAPEPAAGSGTSHAVWPWAAAAALAGAVGGYLATGLWGMAMLGGGLGMLGPPFLAAPAQRRRHTAVALAWQTWTRQIAELAAAGAGLADALAASVPHAPPQISDTVHSVAQTARSESLSAAIARLARAGPLWEPEIAAGLAVAAASGGPVTAPLRELASRIGDTVALHRARTEAVVALWTQTIALLGLAAGVIALMYRNNPAYFEPYRTPAGQTVLVLIAMVLLGATAFLVRHSVVRVEPSLLVAPKNPRRSPRPL